MAALIRAGYRNYLDIIVKNYDPRSDDLFLMSNIWQAIFVLMLYLYFVFILGPKIMKNRPPYKLVGIMRAYNLLQVILNCLLFTQAVKMGWIWKYKWICEPIDYSHDPVALTAVKSCWYYCMLKMFDFMDTVFIVLRKKDQQISFLHVYHHGGIFFGSWIITKYYPGGHATFIGFLNTIVHAIMYAYYFITVTWPEHKITWMKKSLTQLQMLQFFLIAIHAAVALILRENCKYSKFVASMCLIENFLMLLLFSDFYRKAYKKKQV
ncbi:very long chain fatty acid elongase 7-like [Periplaneta americana]|uniref:very long chain fatty acid elongase 7-like n=1 Tax=Periplaneta americana TaxID=6978 RepID=UPI0037E8CBA1